MKSFTRRSVLRGSVGGMGVAVGLPLLDCFLNNNGTAFAAGGALPIRFGTWFWGCGMNTDRWVPKKVGQGFDYPIELKPLEPYKDQVSILSGFKVELDGMPNLSHVSGIWTLRTGEAPSQQQTDSTYSSFDVMVSDTVGVASRFPSIDVTALGDKKNTFSRRNGSTLNYSEASPAALYARIFGDGFQDPNNAAFKPDPKVILRKSALSGVYEESKLLARDFGAADRARLDEYFTAVRQLEHQVALQLEPPAPAQACSVPGKVTEATLGTDIDDVLVNHKLMAQLIAMALACNQTKVFNVTFSDGASSLRRQGFTDTHHVMTHNEPLDPSIGYQPNASWFVDRSMEALGEFLKTMTSFKEGDGTLLDTMHVNCHSDTSFAKIHSLDDFPVIFAGKARGRVKTGVHVAGKGDPVSRTVLTSLRIMGVSADKFGTRSMETNKVVSEVIA